MIFKFFCPLLLHSPYRPSTFVSRSYNTPKEMISLKTRLLSSKLFVLFMAAAMLVNLAGIPSPASAAPGPDLFYKAYVTSFNTRVVDVVNLKDNTVEKGKIKVGSEPNSAGFNPTGEQVYVTNRGGSNVSVIDPASDTVIRS